MPSLLAPAFLAGLLAVAIPILVHLRMRERRTSLPFPSLMFMRRIPHKSYRRRTLQNLLLFAARTLAVILLCLAFARPFFPVKAGASPGAVGPLGRVIALDVSASMQYQGVFARAIADAEKVIAGSKPEDPLGLLLFSDQVQGVAPPSTDHARALAALRAAKPGARSTKFAPALRLAADWLSELKVDRREIVLITDGQTRALTGVSEVSLPKDCAIVVQSVAAPNPDNAAVAEVTVEHVTESERTFGVVTARVIHQGPAVRTMSASLEVAGRTTEERTIELPASGAMNVTFNRAPLPSGVSKGRILLKTDGLEIDNTFNFVLGSAADIGVLALDDAPFVARALEIGDRPSFDVRRRSALSEADLAGRSLVILGESGARSMSTPASARLARFVREGGGLLETGPLSELRGEAAGLLPGTWGPSVNRLAERGASLGFVDLDHPALFAFKQARGSDFSRARFLQYRPLKMPAGSNPEDLRVLARFDDGRYALVEAAFGLGRVLAFTSPLDGIMSDLPVQPLFLPLIHELSRYASAHKDTPLYHRVGGVGDFETQTRTSADPLTATIAPSGRREQRSGAASGLELEEVGFYEGARASGARDLLAANVESAESDLTSLDQGELQAAVRPARGVPGPEAATAPVEASARQAWWRAALLSLAVLMGMETLFSNLRGPKVSL